MIKIQPKTPKNVSAPKIYILAYQKRGSPTPLTEMHDLRSDSRNHFSRGPSFIYLNDQDTAEASATIGSMSNFAKTCGSNMIVNDPDCYH